MTSQTYSAWRKSTRSDEGNCVEVSPSDDATHVGVRDSKDEGGPVLEFDRKTWGTFLDGVRDGTFDL
jgi:uncharacterized protein DUF397